MLLLVEKRNHEHEKILYCNIKKLNFVEKARVYKRISSEQADTHTKESLDTIRKFANLIPNFNIDMFAKVDSQEMELGRQPLCH